MKNNHDNPARYILTFGKWGIIKQYNKGEWVRSSDYLEIVERLERFERKNNNTTYMSKRYYERNNYVLKSEIKSLKRNLKIVTIALIFTFVLVIAKHL